MGFLRKQLCNENIICISTSDWEKPYGSKQQIMSILAVNNRILYVEAQVSLLHIFLNPLTGLKRLTRSLKGAVKRGSLYIYTPLPLLPFGNYFLFVNWVNQKLLLFVVKKLTDKLYFRKPILWIYSVNSAELLGKLNEKLSVYYCLDDFPSEIAHNKRKKTLQSLENRLLIHSGIAFACTGSLLEERKSKRGDIRFVRNGVDFESLNIKIDPAKAPDDIKGIPSPRIGIVGTFDSRIDTDLIFFIAEQKLDWQIVLIGNNTPKGFNIKSLKRHPNVHNLGFKENKLIATYIGFMDICIIPYYTHGFNRHLFPLKTLEYLAAGKPVVATCLPELEEFRETVALTHNKEEFINAIKCYLESPGDPSKRKAIAREHSWDSKVKWLESAIQAELNMKEENAKQYHSYSIF